MKLVELLKKASEGYGDGDGFLATYFDEETGEFKEDASGDTLAEFVVRELSETFDPDASEEDQIEEARRVMNNAVRDIEGVLDKL